MPSRLLPSLALLLAMLIWSSSFIALKIGLVGFSPLQLIAGRMAVAVLCLLPFSLSLWKAFRQGRHWPLLLLMLLCEPCLYFLCEANALRFTSASQAGMILSILPVVTGAVAVLVLHERLSCRSWLGCALAVGGAVWLSMSGNATESAPRPVLGNFLEFLAVCCATGYTISLKILSRSYAPLHLTAAQSLGGLLFFGPLALLFPGESFTAAVNSPLPSWAPAAAMLFLGSCVTFGGYGLYNFGVSRLPASQATTYINLIPVFTLLLGVTLLEERFLPAQYAASALVIAGVLLSQRTYIHRKKA